LVLIPTALLVTLLTRRFLSAAAGTGSGSSGQEHDSEQVDDWAGFAVLSFITVCRSTIFAGLNTFLALYWMSRWEVTPTAATTILALFLGVGLGGVLLGGWLADRFGHRAIIRIGFGLAALALPALLAAPGSTSALIVLTILAVTFYAPSSLLVMLGQHYLPNRIGVASGVTLGLGVSVGGMMAPLLGVLADWQGVQAVMVVVEAILVAAVLLSLLLPAIPDRHWEEVTSPASSLPIAGTASRLETSS
jgi:MFS transporter, FSR family, fosmidomycin resistance protein